MAFVPAPSVQPAEPPKGRAALFVAGVAALLASTCCLGPLVLLALGVSGAWIANLGALEPYRPLFMAAAAVALFLAWRRIWRPAAACAPGEVCAVVRVRRGYKMLFAIVAALLSIALAFPSLAPYFY